jgi:hypothetical protein
MGIRDPTESFRSSLAFFARRRFRHLLSRKVLRLLKRKLWMLLGWRSEVVFDVHKTFGDIYHRDGSSLTEDLLDISEHIITREKTQQWASNLRFLTVSSPTLYKSGSGTRNCNCDAWEPVSENLTTQLRLTAYGEVKIAPITLRSPIAGGDQGLSRKYPPSEGLPAFRLTIHSPSYVHFTYRVQEHSATLLDC